MQNRDLSLPVQTHHHCVGISIHVISIPGNFSSVLDVSVLSKRSVFLWLNFVCHVQAAYACLLQIHARHRNPKQDDQHHCDATSNWEKKHQNYLYTIAGCNQRCGVWLRLKQMSTWSRINCFQICEPQGMVLQCMRCYQQIWKSKSSAWGGCIQEFQASPWPDQETVVFGAKPQDHQLVFWMVPRCDGFVDSILH